MICPALGPPGNQHPCRNLRPLTNTSLDSAAYTMGSPSLDSVKTLRVPLASLVRLA